MSIRCFTSQDISFQINEKMQIERITKHLYESFESEDQNLSIILDFVKGKSQFDIIAIKEDSVIIIEAKDYEGEISGDENSEWIAKKPDESENNLPSNPFKQAKEQRFSLIRYLNEILPEISPRFNQGIYNIAVFVCFNENSSFNDIDIDFRTNMWFRVVSEANIGRLVKEWSSNEFHFRKDEIEKIIDKMRVNEVDLSEIIEINTSSNSDENEEIDVESLSELTVEELEKISEQIMNIHIEGSFNLNDIRKIVKPEAAILFLKEGIENEFLSVQEETKEFQLKDDWSDTISNIKQIQTGKKLGFSIYQNDFWLKPEKSIENDIYQGVYRGKKYHLDSKYNFWWKKGGKADFRTKISFSDNDDEKKIVNRKFLGGSFRITEDKEILTIVERGGDFVPIYIGQLKGQINIDNLEWQPKNLKAGDLWPSIYDGTQFSVNDDHQVFIKIGGKKLYSKEGHEDLASAILKLKPDGGRFKIDENRNILTLMYNIPYPNKIKKQLENLSNYEKNIIDIRQKNDGDGMVPIYIGKFKDSMKFKKAFDIDQEWTDDDDEDFLKRIGVL